MGAGAGIAFGAVGSTINAIGSWQQMKEGRDMQREAQANIDNFQYQDLDALQISTEGAEIEQRQIDTNMATTLDSIKEAGSRSVIGAAGRLVNAGNAAANKIGARLDEEQTKLNNMKVGIKEQRGNQELAGYGAMLQAGRQDVQSGRAGIGNAFSSMAPILGGLNKE